MHGFHSAASIVVGIDGSQAALGAAVWAAREAASRGVPLKLAYVIYNADPRGVDGNRSGPATDQLAAARAALSEAQRVVEADAAPARIDVETEVLRGNPLATLIELSRAATMVCVGSIGVERTCHHAGSTAAALAGSAWCPVAVIRSPAAGRSADQSTAVGHIVAEVDAGPENLPDNNAVLEFALAEARLRGAPLVIVTVPSGDGAGDTPAQTRLNRTITHWVGRYPDVSVELATVPAGIAGYLTDRLAAEAGSIQLFVSATRDRRSLGWPADAGGCSVLTVAGTRS